MFRRLPDLGGEPLRFTIDGRAATGRRGDTVAAALLAAGIETCRTTPVSGAPRAPYCMMGVCFECLVRIDGVGSRQGCLVALAEGMRVETQRGRRVLDRSTPGPHAEVAGAAGPRSTQVAGASFEAELRSAPQDEAVGQVFAPSASRPL